MFVGGTMGSQSIEGTDRLYRLGEPWSILKPGDVVRMEWIHDSVHIEALHGKCAEDVREVVYRRLVKEGNLDHTARWFQSCRDRRKDNDNG